MDVIRVYRKHLPYETIRNSRCVEIYPVFRCSTPRLQVKNWIRSKKTNVSCYPTTPRLPLALRPGYMSPFIARHETQRNCETSGFRLRGSNF